jgi:hypothetical protein
MIVMRFVKVKCNQIFANQSFVYIIPETCDHFFVLKAKVNQTLKNKV